MSFCPIVSCSCLAENEVVGSEELTEGTSTDGVHSTRFKIHQNCSWDVSSSCSFVEINIDSFELEVRVSVICTSGVDSVFVRDDFPEFSSDLVTTLSSLYVNDFSHVFVMILCFFFFEFFFK